jgi:type III pantothenate kinase
MPNVDLGVTVRLKNPREVGADRLINAVAGLVTYKPPLLIVDFGTATTLDVVDADGAYCGGAIAPGADMSLQTLHMAAAQLPRVAIARPRHVIGGDTIEAIQSGVFWGYVGLIEGLIERMRAEVDGKLTVIATGGLSALFRDASPALQHIDPDLTLRGLQLIHQRNRKK